MRRAGRSALLLILERTLLVLGAAACVAALLGLGLQHGLSAWDRHAFAARLEATAARAESATDDGAGRHGRQVDDASEPAPREASSATGGTPAPDAAPSEGEGAALLPGSERSLDTTTWSASRLADYLGTFAHVRPVTRLARLEIPRLELSVIVLDGTDEWTLNRGVGRIPGTALPGAEDNVGIAGHRDGFFRPLRKLRAGDRIDVVAPDGARTYRVEWIRVVEPEDVEVLDPTDGAALTLVTCHPFYYVGSAPRRYVVRARAAGETRAAPAVAAGG